MQAATITRARGTSLVRIAVPGVRLQLAAVVALSAVLRTLAAARHTMPRIFPDSYIYAALGRSLAHGHLEIRGGATHFPALLEPLVAAPIWALEPVSTAYRLIQLENALFMSAAAIPAYLLARRLRLSNGWALFCGVFAVAIPDVGYSSYLLSDPVAYPLVLSALCAGLIALERPTRRSQAALLVFATLATATRVQYVVLFGAFAVAAVALERRRVLRTYKVVALPLAAVGGGILAFGPGRALGFYSGVLHLHLTFQVARWAVVDLFLLALASGVVLVPGAVAGLLRPRGRHEKAFAVLAAAFATALLAEAALYGSNGSDRFQERYLFTLLPLVPVAFGLYRRHERPARVQVLVLTIALLVALARVPLSGYVVAQGSTSSLFLGAVGAIQVHLGTGTGALAVALVASAAAGLAALYELRRLPVAAAAAAALILVGLSSAAATSADGALSRLMSDAYAPANPSWIDAARLGPVTAIETPAAPPGQLLMQLFWNGSVTRELLFGGAEATDVFDAPRVKVAEDGTLRSDDSIVRTPILWQGFGVTAELSGATLVRRAKTFQLWKPTATPRLALLETGRYWDGWLAQSGLLTVWPGSTGRVRGVVSFTLSLPLRTRAVRVRFGDRTLSLRPGRHVAVRLPLDGRGPQTLRFASSHGGFSDDGVGGLRPVTVRSTLPVFSSRRTPSS